MVIEDDYDAEYRYDRPPLAALQGLAPDRVIYMGTVSKTLAPALRLGWLALPSRLIGAVVEQKALADHGCPTLDQLAVARLLRAVLRSPPAPGAPSLQGATRRARAGGGAAPARRPRDRPRGGAARDRPPRARGRRPGTPRGGPAQLAWVYPLGYAYMEPRPVHDGLVLGYANLAEPAIDEGTRRLARALEEVPDCRAPTNHGGAIAR